MVRTSTLLLALAVFGCYLAVDHGGEAFPLRDGDEWPALSKMENTTEPRTLKNLSLKLKELPEKFKKRVKFFWNKITNKENDNGK